MDFCCLACACVVYLFNRIKKIKIPGKRQRYPEHAVHGLIAGVHSGGVLGGEHDFASGYGFTHLIGDALIGGFAVGIDGENLLFSVFDSCVNQAYDVAASEIAKCAASACEHVPQLIVIVLKTETVVMKAVFLRETVFFKRGEKGGAVSAVIASSAFAAGKIGKIFDGDSFAAHLFGGDTGGENAAAGTFERCTGLGGIFVGVSPVKGTLVQKTDLLIADKHKTFFSGNQHMNILSYSRLRD